jgi:hypothetical protein
MLCSLWDSEALKPLKSAFHLVSKEAENELDDIDFCGWNVYGRFCGQNTDDDL